MDRPTDGGIRFSNQLLPPARFVAIGRREPRRLFSSPRMQKLSCPSALVARACVGVGELPDTRPDHEKLYTGLQSKWNEGRHCAGVAFWGAGEQYHTAAGRRAMDDENIPQELKKQIRCNTNRITPMCESKTMCRKGQETYPNVQEMPSPAKGNEGCNCD